MDDRDEAGITSAISKPRLDRYLADCDGNLPAALELYAWNVAAANEFRGLLQHLEVTWRNVVHERMTRHFARPDWWDAPELRLHPKDANNVHDTRARLGNGCVPDKMVADLPFGFWVSLLGAKAGYHSRVWQPVLAKAFPAEARNRTGRHDDFKHLAWFRNRIAHHEAIYSRDLRADHRNVMRNLQYLSPSMAGWVQRYDRVPALLRARPRFGGR